MKTLFDRTSVHERRVRERGRSHVAVVVVRHVAVIIPDQLVAVTTAQERAKYLEAVRAHYGN